jgi:hypothetical protein
VLGIGNHITPEDNDGEKKWQTLRSGFDAAFSAKAVPQYVPTLVEEVCFNTPLLLHSNLVKLG